MLPPVPYKGKEPYLFISYAHKDADRVWPIVARLQMDGYRVWYDEGIDPGTEWDENIASRVTGCGYFLAFLSENYLASENCRDELNFARDLEKQQALIFLENVQLPTGMSLRFGRHPRFRADRPVFYKKLYDAPGIRAFTTGKKTRPKGRWVMPVCLGVLVLAAALTVPKLLKKAPVPEPETVPATTEPVQTAPVETEPEIVPFTFRQSTFLNESGIKLTAQSLFRDEQGRLIMDCLVESTVEEDVQLLVDAFYINGYQCFPNQNLTAEGNTTQTIQLVWEQGDLLEANTADLQPEDIRIMEGNFRLIGLVSDPVAFLYYPYGREYAADETYEPEPDDLVVADHEDCRVFLRDWYYDESGNWIGDFAMVNLTDRLMSVNVSIHKTNGYNSGYWWSVDVRPGCALYRKVRLDEWEYTQQEKILQLEGNVHWADAKTNDEFGTQSFVLRPEGGEAEEFPARQLTSADRLLAENDDFRVAVIGSYEFHERAYAYCIYCQNLSGEALDFHLSNKVENGADDGEWTVCWLEPGEQGYREFLYHHDGQTSAMTLTGAITAQRENGEIITEQIYVNFSW